MGDPFCFLTTQGATQTSAAKTPQNFWVHLKNGTSIGEEGLIPPYVYLHCHVGF